MPQALRRLEKKGREEVSPVVSVTFEAVIRTVESDTVAVERPIRAF